MSSRERIGKYVVKGILGRGAMGEVLLGEDPLVGRLVALKLMQGGDALAAERFLQEARVIGGFQHPNIVMLYEFGFEQGEPFLAMERVQGQSFESWMRAPHTLGEQLAVAEGIAAALAYAHARGVLHRDIKPSNAHVTPEGQAKLMDFGIARSAAARLTATGTVMGTPMYMAPETLETAEYSERSDLYSLAVVLYEMWAGANPFTAPSIATTLRNVLSVDPRDLAEVRLDLPPALARAVMACLSKSPAARLAGVKDLHEVLAAARSQPAGSAPSETAALDPGTVPGPTSRVPEAAPELPPSPTDSRRSRAGLGLALVIGLGAALWLLRGDAPVAPGRETAVVARRPTVAEPALPQPSPTAPPQAAPVESASTPRAAAVGTGHTPRLEAPTPATPSPVPSLPTPTPTPLPAAQPTQTPVPVAVATPKPERSPPPPSPAQVAPIPMLVSVSPASARRGASVRLEVRVEAWSEAFKPAVLHGRRPAVGLSVSAIKALGGDRVQLDVSIEADASLGAYTLVLKAADGRVSNGLGFEVTL